MLWLVVGVVVFLVAGWLGLFWWLIPYPDTAGWLRGSDKA